MDIEAAIRAARLRAGTQPAAAVAIRTRETPPDVLEWLAGNSAARGPGMVTCTLCRHVHPNPHTPAQGWALCDVLPHGRWPAAPRSCPRFEPSETRN